MRRYGCAFVAATVVVLIAPSSRANTIQVAQDGTGDFTSLFDAVASAATGDTVLIAPGNYTDVRIAPEINADLEFAAAITVAELTIIGESQDQVIVGVDRPGGASSIDPVGIAGTTGANIRVQGLTLQGFSWAIAAAGNFVEVADVRVSNSLVGLSSVCTGPADVTNCVFEDIGDVAVSIEQERGGTGARIRKSTFARCLLGVNAEVSLTTVEFCRFDDGRSGVQSVFGATTRITDCTVSTTEYGVYCSSGAVLELYRTDFASDMGINVAASGSLYGTDNVLRGGTYATMEILWAGDYDFHGNHILHSVGYSLIADAPVLPEKTVDFSGNYWGSVDSEEIESWIFDAKDRPGGTITIVVDPIADGPIEAGIQGFGALKARFASPEN